MDILITPPPLRPTTPALEQRHTAYESRRRAEHLSALNLVPAPQPTASLADLHRQRLHARDAATPQDTGPAGAPRRPVMFVLAFSPGEVGWPRTPLS
ncbi:hypothetical protein ABZW18_10440 [Streptomyces sp. NPDC004647]|uniref:hypothetical protein n=1 Tax=Streptomyces sp. NPDC004647 TaxID=3154671 RepID=UPI0033AC988B